MLTFKLVLYFLIVLLKFGRYITGQYFDVNIREKYDALYPTYLIPVA